MQNYPYTFDVYLNTSVTPPPPLLSKEAPTTHNAIDTLPDLQQSSIPTNISTEGQTFSALLISRGLLLFNAQCWPKCSTVTEVFRFPSQTHTYIFLRKEPVQPNQLSCSLCFLWCYLRVRLCIFYLSIYL